jgi:aerobic-type carbon monoxide dehydrogenase small subunit (CoxS/CutS family)
MIQLKVNGAEQSFDGDPEMPLLWYLRGAMWLLPGGTDHAGGGFIEQQKEADRSLN